MALPDDEISSRYIPAQGYSNKRDLDAPRVNVPPPDMRCQEGKHTFQSKAPPLSTSTEQYGTPDFLRALVNNHKLDVTHSMLNWQYEMRRTAQPILPFLFLGPSSVAKDSTFLTSHGITLLVAVRPGKAVRDRPAFLDPTTFPSSAGLETWKFDYDHHWDSVSCIRPTIRAINQHLEASCARTPIQAIQDVRGKVLIFCETGNGRSALLAAAYLVTVYGVDAISAIHMVQSQRFSITLSDEMKNALLTLQTIVEAERDVSDANAAMAPSLSRNRSVPIPSRGEKRNIDESTKPDDDEMVDVFEDAPASNVRAGVAPFSDAVD